LLRRQEKKGALKTKTETPERGDALGLVKRCEIGKGGGEIFSIRAPTRRLQKGACQQRKGRKKQETPISEKPRPQRGKSCAPMKGFRVKRSRKSLGRIKKARFLGKIQSQHNRKGGGKRAKEEIGVKGRREGETSTTMKRGRKKKKRDASSK